MPLFFRSMVAFGLTLAGILTANQVAAQSTPPRPVPTGTLTVTPLPACPSPITSTPFTPTATLVPSRTPTAAPGTPTPLPTVPPTPTANPSAGYLGIAVEQVQRCGVRILEVKGNSPAEKAGLQAGDVIVAVNTKPISGVEEIRGFIVTSQVGEEILLTYQRATGQFDARVKLTDIPKSTVATLPATEPATPAK